MAILGLDTLLGLDALLGIPPDPAWGCSLANARTLEQMPEDGDRTFRRWLCAFATTAAVDTGTVLALIQSFNLDFAFGVQLDLLGAWMGLPRQGQVSDDRYRTWLRIQALLLSGKDTGKATNILTITRTFLGPTPGKSIFLHNGQYAYELEFPDFEFAGSEVPQLIRFLRIATWAAVQGVISWNLGGVYAYDAASTIPVPGEGLWAYDESDSIPVADHLVWSAIFTT